MMEVMSPLRIGPEEQRTRLVELVSALGDCDPGRARTAVNHRRVRHHRLIWSEDPKGFGGCQDPWSDVALALVALRR